MMLDVSKILVGLLLGAAIVVFFGGVAKALRKRWKGAVFTLVFSAVLGLLGIALLVFAALSLGGTGSQNPTDEYRSLFAVAIDIAYGAFWLILLSVPVAVVEFFRVHKKLREPRTEGS